MKARYFSVHTLISATTLVALCAVPLQSSASHFRGGSLTWQAVALDPDGIKNDVELIANTAWKEWESAVSLDIDPDVNYTNVSLGVTFVNGTDWLDAEYVLRNGIYHLKDLDPTKIYNVAFEGGNRISELKNNADGSWSIQTIVNLKDDNLAPKIDLPIVMDVPQLNSQGQPLQQWEFLLKSRDPNADSMRFRMATTSELGGQKDYKNPPGLTIDRSTAMIRWIGSGNLPAGLYSAGFVVEDLDDMGVVKSKSHVDVIFNLVGKSQVSFTKPSEIP